MNRMIQTLLVIVGIVCSSSTTGGEESEPLKLQSPDGQIKVTFQLKVQDCPVFDVKYRDVTVAVGSLGLEFAGTGRLNSNLRVVDVRRKFQDQVYPIPVGKTFKVRDQHQEMVVALQEHIAPHRKLYIAFRASDDGVAFRYGIPVQPSLAKFVLTNERTILSFPDDPVARALPLKEFTTPYEAYYDTFRVSKIDQQKLLGLPLLLERPLNETKSIWIAVTEANLKDYAGLYLSGVDGEPGTLTSKLSPLPGREDGAKVLGTAPFASPWRVLMIADNPGELIESNIVFNLNDPSAIKDTSWIKPGKTTFPWWNHYVLEGVDFEPGVNTATIKHYIDFCAEHGIPYHTLDGLDTAWYGGPIQPSGPTNVTKAAPTIDLPEVLRYAKAKGVRLRLWVHWKALRPKIDEAFRTYEKWGIEGVMVDFMDRDDQEMVRFYYEMAQKAAKHHLTLTLHGAYKPTGMERTWPNVLSYEAVLNQEYNKWQPEGTRGTPPEHNLDVAFVRMLAGPLDYHQGGMRSVLPEDYHFSDVAPPVQGTRGHQLAMSVVYQNHLPMIADYPTALRGQDGFDFIVEVPTTWDETRVLHAELGKCLVIARRAGDRWYLGGMTAGEARELKLPLTFLSPGDFDGELLLDQPTGPPTAVNRVKQKVSQFSTLSVAIPRCGGFAARLTLTQPQKNEPSK